MKAKKHIKAAYIVWGIIYYTMLPQIFEYAQSARNGNSKGGELMLVFVPLIMCIAYKNYKDTPHSKENFKD